MDIELNGSLGNRVNEQFLRNVAMKRGVDVVRLEEAFIFFNDRRCEHSYIQTG